MIKRLNLGLLYIPFLFAAQAGAHSPVEEVFVTAEKREEKISEVPLAIRVVGGDFIDDSASLGLSDLEYALPSVNFGRGGRCTRGEVAIRGIGGFSRNIGSDGRVVVYVDDVPLGRSSAFDANLLDVKQIEVVKGPQGTLFGTNTIAGAINISTFDPTDVVEGAFSHTSGNRGLNIFDAKTNLPLSENSAIRLQLSSIDEDGHIQNLQNDTTLQGRNSQSARIKYRNHVSETLTYTLQGDWLADANPATNAEALGDSGAYRGFEAAPEPNQVAHDAKEYETRKLWGAAFKANWELASGANVASISALRRSEFDELSEEDYSALPIATSTFNEQYKQWSQELRYASPLYQHFDYVVGAFLSQAEIESDRSASLGANTIVTPGALDVNTSAIFLHGNFRLNLMTELTFGIRGQYEEKHLDYSSINPSGLAGFDNGNITDSQHYATLLPKAGLNFYMDKSLLYFSVSRGSKSGGWNADFVQDLNDIAFDQEYAINYEAGVKTHMFSDRLYAGFSLFHMRYTDFQIFQFVLNDGVLGTKLTNAGKALSEGLEVDLTYAVMSNATFTLGATYTDARFEKFENGDNNGTDFSGNYLPYAPKVATYIGSDINFTAFNTFMNWHIDYSYSDGYYSDASNGENYRAPDFHTVNSHFSAIPNPHIELRLWVRNLSDETQLRFRDESFLSIPRGVYQMPRSYGLSVSVKYD